MPHSTHSANFKYRASVSEEFDGTDPLLDRVHYTLKVYDEDLNQTIYQTHRDWVADRNDEYHEGVQVQSLGFDEKTQNLIINDGLTAPNCIPFNDIIDLVDEILLKFPDEIDAYVKSAKADSASATIPPALIQLIRDRFTGLGTPQDWMGHLEHRLMNEPEDETAFL